MADISKLEAAMIEYWDDAQDRDGQTEEEVRAQILELVDKVQELDK